MALQKEITDERGVITNYHKIDNIQLYKDSKNGAATYCLYTTVSSYTTAEVRTADAGLYANSRNYSFNCTPEMIEQNSIYKVTYDLLKTTETFKDAIDV